MEGPVVSIHIHLPELTDFQVDAFAKAVYTMESVRLAGEEYKRQAEEFKQNMLKALAESVRNELAKLAREATKRSNYDR